MANIPISALPAATALVGTELVPVVQAGETRRTTTAGIGGGAFPFAAGQPGTTVLTTTPRTMQARLAKNLAIAGVDFGLAIDGVTDDAPALNAMIQALGERGGGIIQIPCDLTGNGRFMRISSTIDNNVPGVLIEGPVGGNNGMGYAPFGLIIRPDFNGVALKHRSPRGPTNPKLYGGGFKNLSVQGSYGLAGNQQILLEVDQINYGVYHVNLLNTAGPMCARFTCGYGNAVNGNDSGSTQFIDLDMYCGQFAGREDGFPVGNPNAHGLVLEGTETNNQSLWTGAKLLTQMVNGKGLWIKNADTIHFDEFISYDDSSSTALTELMDWQPGYGGTATTTKPLTFSASPLGVGFTAEGTYTVRNGAFDSYLITKAGSGYVTAPTVSFGGTGVPTGVSARVLISNGKVAYLTEMVGGTGGTDTTLFAMSFNGPGSGAAGVFRVGPTAVALGTGHTITSAGSGGTDGTYPIIFLGVGTNCTGTYTVAGGVLTSVNVTNGGFGVFKQPTPYFLAFSGANQPVVTWTLSNGVNWYEMTAPGSGYSRPYDLIIAGGGGSGAKAYFRVSGGGVAEIVVTCRGDGYTSAPLLSFENCPGLTGVTATPVIVSGGVGSISIGAAGAGGTNRGSSVSFAASAGITGAAAKPVIGPISLWCEAGASDNARFQGGGAISFGLWSAGGTSVVAGKNWPGANTITIDGNMYFQDGIDCSSITIDRFNGGNGIPAPSAGIQAQVYYTDDLGSSQGGANLVNGVAAANLSQARYLRDDMEAYSPNMKPGLAVSGAGTGIAQHFAFDNDTWSFEQSDTLVGRLRPIKGVMTDFQIWASMTFTGGMQYQGQVNPALLSKGYISFYNPTQHWTRTTLWGTANEDGTGARVNRYFDVGMFTDTSANTSIGYEALKGLQSVTAAGINSTAIGFKAGRALSANGSGVFVGFEAGVLTTGQGNVAIGSQAASIYTTGLNGVFIGFRAGNLSTTGSNHILIGNQVQADSPSSDDQINIGGVYFQNRFLYQETTDPAAPAGNKAVVYARDNGAGKTQLCVRFNTGAVQVIATEP